MATALRREDVGHGGLRLTIDRPESRNALDLALFDELEAELVDAARSPEVRTIVLSGSGGTFSAGANLRELAAMGVQDSEALFRRGQEVCRLFETLGKPTIAQVDGYALGGGFELCLAASCIVASSDARFGLPEAGLGLIPGYGGTQRLVRCVGRNRAYDVMLRGAWLDAATAFEIGLLVVEPVPPEELDARITELTAEFATKSPSAIASIIRAVDAAYRLPIDAGLQFETELAIAARQSSDGRLGIEKYLAKERPCFPGISLDEGADA